MASASYITGSHAFKTGMTMQWGTNSRTFSSNAQINTLVFNAGLLGAAGERHQPGAVHRACPARSPSPSSNGPATREQKVKSDLGFFVQDTWTMNKLTLNLGGRFDHFNAEVPAQSSPAGNWIQARNFAAIPNVPNWNDWSVRLAGAYDLFGNGKTAHQGQRQQVHRGGGRGLCRRTSTRMTYSHADARLGRLRRQQVDPRCGRQHPVQRSDRRHVELRPDHQPARSGSEARLQLGIQRARCSTS